MSLKLELSLQLTTIFISKMEGEPIPDNDIKMIDIWLILCQMVPMLRFVQPSRIIGRTRSRRRKKTQMKKKGGKT